MKPTREGLLRARFQSGRAARRAAEELKLAGFGPDQIEVEEGRPPLFDALLPPEERELRPGEVAVHADGRLLEAAAILHRYGGEDPPDALRVEHRSPQPGGLSLELRSEAAEPRIEAVQVGEVRISKVVVTEIQTIEVELRHEELQVEHVPATGSPAERRRRGRGEAPFEQGEVIRIPLYGEQAEIVKREVVREEVVVRKRPVAATVGVPTRLRREEPKVTSSGRAPVHLLSPT